jgi:hypothetical protein
MHIQNKVVSQHQGTHYAPPTIPPVPLDGNRGEARGAQQGLNRQPHDLTPPAPLTCGLTSFSEVSTPFSYKTLQVSGALRVPRLIHTPQSSNNVALPVCYHHKPGRFRNCLRVSPVILVRLQLLPCNRLTPFLPVSAVKAFLPNASLVSLTFLPLPMLNV